VYKCFKIGESCVHDINLHYGLCKTQPLQTAISNSMVLLRMQLTAMALLCIVLGERIILRGCLFTSHPTLTPPYLQRKVQYIDSCHSFLDLKDALTYLIEIIPKTKLVSF
jgi:hypothetical protein